MTDEQRDRARRLIVAHLVEAEKMLTLWGALKDLDPEERRHVTVANNFVLKAKESIS